MTSAPVRYGTYNAEVTVLDLPLFNKVWIGLERREIRYKFYFS